MMYRLASEIRQLIYLMICFQCLLNLTNGSVYQKYIKFVTYIMTMCICCRIVISFVNNFAYDIESADEIYESWEAQWKEYDKFDVGVKN